MQWQAKIARSLPAAAPRQRGFDGNHHETIQPAPRSLEASPQTLFAMAGAAAGSSRYIAV
jgi:hypothetical protein